MVMNIGKFSPHSIMIRIVNNFATTKSPGFSPYYKNTRLDTTNLYKRS